MMKASTFNLPKYSKVLYQFDTKTGFYKQAAIEVQGTPIVRLPLEIRLDNTTAPRIHRNANKIMLGRQVRGKYSFRTGIQETTFKGWYLGNDFELIEGKKVISLILFRFSLDGSKFKLYYLHKYDIEPSYLRMRIINRCVIPQLIK